MTRHAGRDAVGRLSPPAVRPDGLQSDVRSFNTRYVYTDSNQRKNWHNATGSTVIAAHEGQSRQQIIIMAHLDTYAPQSDKDVENNLGGDPAGDRRQRDGSRRHAGTC